MLCIHIHRSRYINSTANDSFVAMCPGGYSIIDWFKPQVAERVASTLAGYMLDLGMSAFADNTTPSTWQPFLAHEQIDAAFHWIKADDACYSADPSTYANVQWVSGKPVVRGRSELQHKCHILSIPSTENAEMKENYP